MIECLDLARRKHGFHLIAYVVMPEHVHLLAWPRLPSDPMHLGLGLAKQVFAQRAIARWIELEAPVISKITDEHGHKVVWQPGGGYDRNIMTDDERVEKTYYIHNNRVTRGLVKGATDWEWSSALWYSQERNRSKLSMDPACRPS
ncbi:MAG TPA: hypothetical protein VEB22_02085 [Phycisphaerales bacterium]|nr:hypothetical protein [Phycisphaerales bacterium]